MNFVKKSFKNNLNYLILILFILSLLIMLLVIKIRNSEKLEFLTIPNYYSVIVDENENLKLNVKCNRNDTMYLEKKMIDQVYLFDNLTKDEYLVELKDIKENENYHYQNNTYYDYDLNLVIPFKTDSIINLQNFYLVIHYLNEESLNLLMGQLSLITKDYYDNDIVISSMQGLVNKVDNKELLVGIHLKMSSNLPDITLKKVNVISYLVKTNLKDSLILDNLENNNQEIKTILNKDYDIYKDNNFESFNYDLNKELGLFIPLIYKKPVQIKTLSLIITYEYNGEIKEELIYPFKFFESFAEPAIEKQIYDYH